MELISNLLLGLLATNSILLLWFYSPLKLTLAKILFKEDITDHTQFEDLIFLKFKSNKLSTLSSCYICFSFWTSLLVGGFLYYLLDMTIYTPIITFFSYPVLCYAIKKYVFDK
jgi:hypothetical protein